MRRSDVAVVVLVMGFGVSSIAAAGTLASGSRSRCAEWRVDVIDATPAEAGDICVALSDVVRYFRALRFRVAPRISVVVRVRPPADASRHARLHGFFDARSEQIVVFRASDVASWGLAWDGGIATSFIRHEFVHMAIVRILRAEHVRLRPEWHELIAYSVQFALMDDTLRDRVLAGYPDVAAAADFTAINEFTYRMDPDRFAVTAYRTYLAQGGPRFVESLLRFQIVPPPLSYPFPMWTPGGERDPQPGARR